MGLGCCPGAALDSSPSSTHSWGVDKAPHEFHLTQRSGEVTESHLNVPHLLGVPSERDIPCSMGSDKDKIPKADVHSSPFLSILKINIFN